jgi:hypothetical protein
LRRWIQRIELQRWIQRIELRRGIQLRRRRLSLFALSKAHSGIISASASLSRYAPSH